jgi:hypothetical protein
MSLNFSPLMMDFLFFVALSGLVLTLVADHLQLLAKYSGAIRQRVAGGYNLAMKVMVLNRIGAVLFYLLLSFNIDHGLAPDKLMFGLAIALVLAVLPTIGLMFWLQSAMNASHPGARVLRISSWQKTIFGATLLATTFNLLGLTVPWVAGATYPNLRLTLTNTSFLFNTIFTVINVFYIEHKLAQLIDTDFSQIHGFVSGVIAARLVSFLMVALGWMLFVCL